MKLVSTPTWAIPNPKEYPQLKEDLTVDVVIIGGGLVGILSAYKLVKAGKKVAVLEAKTIGSGASGYTTAFITQAIDTSLRDLVKMFGRAKTKCIWQSGEDAIRAIGGIVKREKIDCEFEYCSAYIYAMDEKEFKVLEDEHRIAERLGFHTRLVRSKKLPFAHYGFLEIKDQAKFHPIKFLNSVATNVVESGGAIFEHSNVLSIQGTTLKVIETKIGKVFAKDVIVATYMPFNNPKETHYKKGMYASYIFETRIAAGIFGEGIYWDLDNPYHYFRIDKLGYGGRLGGFDRMIIGGEDHREELPVSKAKSFRALQEYLEKLVGKNNYEITRKWTGPVLEPSDGIALIGEYRPHEYVASAFSGNGMTYSMIAALVFHDLILRKKNTWTNVYDPKRKLSARALAKKGLDYAGEFIGAAVKNTLRT